MTAQKNVKKEVIMSITDLIACRAKFPELNRVLATLKRDDIKIEEKNLRLAHFIGLLLLKYPEIEKDPNNLALAKLCESILKTTLKRPAPKSYPF